MIYIPSEPLEYSPKSSAGEITIITPENKTYNEPMSGYYPATYSFENDADETSSLEGWDNPTGGISYLKVVSERFGRKKVIEAYDGGSGTGWIASHYFNNTEGVQKFQTKYPNITLTKGQINGTETISLPNATVNDPDLVNVFTTFSKPGAGSQYERLVDSVNNIGIRLADPNTAKDVSQSDKNLYAANYQKLVVGGEFTEIVNGQEVTRSKPGIDLSETTNLPTPEGLDLDKILKTRSQKFDQNQTKSATFGSKMLYTEGIVLNVMAQGYVPSVEDLAKIKLMDSIGLGTIGLSTEAKRYHNAAQAWVAAQLRDESGAAIAPSEYANALAQYFPQVGDGYKAIEAKKGLREATVSGMINSAGDAFDVMYPTARQYLKYKDDDETIDILNSQGYANELLAKAKLGQTIYFKSTLSIMDLDELIKMAQNPNRETLYNPEMLEILADEISRRN